MAGCGGLEGFMSWGSEPSRVGCWALMLVLGTLLLQNCTSWWRNDCMSSRCTIQARICYSSRICPEILRPPRKSLALLGRMWWWGGYLFWHMQMQIAYIISDLWLLPPPQKKEAASHQEQHKQAFFGVLWDLFNLIQQGNCWRMVSLAFLPGCKVPPG